MRKYSSLTNAIVLATLALLSTSAANAETTEKKYNIGLNPLGLLFSVYNANFDIGIGDKITIGPYFSYYSYNLLSVATTGFGFGGSMMYYLSGPKISSGVYLSPAVGYNMSTVTVLGTNGTTGGLNLKATVGYQWVWDGGFNITLGGGVNVNLSSSTISVGTTTASVGGAGTSFIADFRLGYAF